MEDEVVIIEVKPKLFDITNEPGKCTFRACYKKEMYDANKPITRRPEYLAIRDPAGVYVELLFRIDQAKSNFEKGQIVPQGYPIKVSIPLRMKDRSSTSQIVWYTSFRNLLTHNSTDEFIEEKSEPITRVIAEDQRILCNGYYCIHFSYCKFFNHSPTATIKSSGLRSELEGS
jgi:hypothetical protein